MFNNICSGITVTCIDEGGNYMADESKVEQAKGNIKETVGNVTDNKTLKMKERR